MAEAGDYPECTRLIARNVVAPRRQRLLDRLNQAVVDGEVVAGMDPALTADLLMGPILWRFMTQAMWGPVPDAFPERVVDGVLRGLLPR